MADYWSYPTNYSNGTIDGPSDFFLGYPAFLTDGLTAFVIMVFAFLGLLIFGLPFGFVNALAAASFIMTVMSIYLWTSGVIGLQIVSLFIVVSIFSIIGAAVSKN